MVLKISLSKLRLGYTFAQIPCPYLSKYTLLDNDDAPDFWVWSKSNFVVCHKTTTAVVVLWFQYVVGVGRSDVQSGHRT